MLTESSVLMILASCLGSSIDMPIGIVTISFSSPSTVLKISTALDATLSLAAGYKLLTRSALLSSLIVGHLARISVALLMPGPNDIVGKYVIKPCFVIGSGLRLFRGCKYPALPSFLTLPGSGATPESLSDLTKISCVNIFTAL